MDVNSIDQSGPIKSWFKNTFSKLGKRTRLNDGGHLKAKSRKSSISFSQADKMYQDRATNPPLPKGMKSWKEKGISVDDAKAISNYENQIGNTSFGEQTYNKELKRLNPDLPKTPKPLVDPIAKEDDNN